MKAAKIATHITFESNVPFSAHPTEDSGKHFGLDFSFCGSFAIQINPGLQRKKVRFHLISMRKFNRARSRENLIANHQLSLVVKLVTDLGFRKRTDELNVWLWIVVVSFEKKKLHSVNLFKLFREFFSRLANAITNCSASAYLFESTVQLFSFRCHWTYYATST